MSEKNTIPQNNLPIYLQEYTISVLGDINSLECPSEPGVGGCVGTQYGCCPDGVTASNADGSNCQNEVGTIQYSTLGVIPSNKKDARVWDLKASGTLKPHDKDYIIHYDLSKVDYSGKVTFENPLSGVITVCGRVISISRKNATWFPCEKTKTVSIIIDQSRWGFSIKKETPFSMDIQLDDDDDTCREQCNTWLNSLVFRDPDNSCEIIPNSNYTSSPCTTDSCPNLLYSYGTCVNPVIGDATCSYVSDKCCCSAKEKSST